MLAPSLLFLLPIVTGNIYSGQYQGSQDDHTSLPLTFKTPTSELPSSFSFNPHKTEKKPISFHSYNSQPGVHYQSEYNFYPNQAAASASAATYASHAAQFAQQFAATQTPVTAVQSTAQIDQTNLAKYSQYLDILQKAYGIQLPGELGQASQPTYQQSSYPSATATTYQGGASPYAAAVQSPAVQSQSYGQPAQQTYSGSVSPYQSQQTAQVGPSGYTSAQLGAPSYPNAAPTSYVSPAPTYQNSVQQAVYPQNALPQQTSYGQQSSVYGQSAVPQNSLPPAYGQAPSPVQPNPSQSGYQPQQPYASSSQQQAAGSYSSQPQVQPQQQYLGQSSYQSNQVPAGNAAPSAPSYPSQSSQSSYVPSAAGYPSNVAQPDRQPASYQTAALSQIYNSYQQQNGQQQQPYPNIPITTPSPPPKPQVYSYPGSLPTAQPAVYPPPQQRVGPQTAKPSYSTHVQSAYGQQYGIENNSVAEESGSVIGGAEKTANEYGFENYEVMPAVVSTMAPRPKPTQRPRTTRPTRPPTRPATRPPTRPTYPAPIATRPPTKGPDAAAGTSIQALTQQVRKLPAVLYVDSRSEKAKETETLLRDTYGLPLVSFYVDKIDRPKAVEKHLQQLTAHKGLPYLFICGTFIGSDQHIDNYHKNGQIPQLVEYVCGDEKKKKKTKKTSS